MNELLPLLERHGLLLVFGCVLLEQGGLPIPAIPALLVAGALGAAGELSIAEVIAVAMVASLLADTAWMLAGRRHGRRILGAVCKWSLSPDSCVRRTDALYDRLGARSLVIAKFVPGFSTLAPPLAGIGGVSLGAFLLWDGLGTLIWSGGAVLFGYTFADAVDSVIDTLGELGKWGTLLVGSALACYVGYRWLWRRKFMRQLRMDRISVAELRQMFDDGQVPLILDVRRGAFDRAGGVIPGAITLAAEEIETRLPQLVAASREAVVYCSCPNEASAVSVAVELRRHGLVRVRPLRGGIDAWIDAGYALEGGPEVATA